MPCCLSSQLINSNPFNYKDITEDGNTIDVHRSESDVHINKYNVHPDDVKSTSLRRQKYILKTSKVHPYDVKSWSLRRQKYILKILKVHPYVVKSTSL